MRSHAGRGRGREWARGGSQHWSNTRTGQTCTGQRSKILAPTGQRHQETPCSVTTAIFLRARCAMPSTDRAYGAT
eukprot:3940944-Rhodomonas_salina.1